MNPWEKACHSCDGSGLVWSGSSVSEGEIVPCSCNGTGFVLMSTSEMLEALARSIGKHGEAGVRYDAEMQEWVAYAMCVDRYGAPDWSAEKEDPAIDYALRAALEAVDG